VQPRIDALVRSRPVDSRRLAELRLDQETYRVAASSVLRALYGAAWCQEQFNAGTDLRAD
jgi:hypothetical protein